MSAKKNIPVDVFVHGVSEERRKILENGADGNSRSRSDTRPLFFWERMMGRVRKVANFIVVATTVVILVDCSTQTSRKPGQNAFVSVFNSNRNRVKVGLTKTDGYQVLLLGRVEINAHDSFSLPEDYLHAYWRIRVETAITHQVWLSEIFQCSAHQEVTVNVNDVLRYTDFSIRDLEDGFDSLSTKKPGVP